MDFVLKRIPDFFLQLNSNFKKPLWNAPTNVYIHFPFVWMNMFFFWKKYFWKYFCAAFPFPNGKYFWKYICGMFSDRNSQCISGPRTISIFSGILPNGIPPEDFNLELLKNDYNQNLLQIMIGQKYPKTNIDTKTILNLKFPNNVKKIGNGDFMWISHLEQIRMGRSMWNFYWKKIAEQICTWNCHLEGLQNIYFMEKFRPRMAENIFFFFMWNLRFNRAQTNYFRFHIWKRDGAKSIQTKSTIVMLYCFFRDFDFHNDWSSLEKKAAQTPVLFLKKTKNANCAFVHEIAAVLSRLISPLAPHCPIAVLCSLLMFLPAPCMSICSQKCCSQLEPWTLEKIQQLQQLFQISNIGTPRQILATHCISLDTQNSNRCCWLTTNFSSFTAPFPTPLAFTCSSCFFPQNHVMGRDTHYLVNSNISRSWSFAGFCACCLHVVSMLLLKKLQLLCVCPVFVHVCARCHHDVITPSEATTIPQFLILNCFWMEIKKKLKYN